MYANAAKFFSNQNDHGWYYYDNGPYDNGPWYLDSGATGHIAADHQKLDSISSSSNLENSEIKIGGGESHPIRGSGLATVQTATGEIKVNPVKYVPSMRKNLLSVGAIADSG